MSIESNTWYLCENGDLDRSYRVPGQALQEHEREDAELLLDEAKNAAEGLGMAARYRVKLHLPSSGNRILARGQRIVTTGEPYHVLREIPDVVPTLADERWGYPAAVRSQLVNPALLRGGLVLLTGSGGSGKSTTVAAAMVSRLKSYGGISYTVEDPPEFELNGIHGRGVCFQFATQTDTEFRNRIHDALRGYPAGVDGSILLIGEIRTPEVAALAIESGLSGHLVLTTLHGLSLESSLARLESLAAQVSGEQTARRDLAECFRLGIHQRLVRKGRGRLDYDSTLLVAQKQDAVIAKIRDGDYHSLASEIGRQNVLLKTHTQLPENA